eukprot:COSAG04_NODE_7762_length_1071_cov_1.358025_1_plen_144_part_10
MRSLPLLLLLLGVAHAARSRKGAPTSEAPPPPPKPRGVLKQKAGESASARMSMYGNEYGQATPLSSDGKPERPLTSIQHQANKKKAEEERQQPPPPPPPPPPSPPPQGDASAAKSDGAMAGTVSTGSMEVATDVVLGSPVDYDL